MPVEGWWFILLDRMHEPCILLIMPHREPGILLFFVVFCIVNHFLKMPCRRERMYQQFVFTIDITLFRMVN